jgi:hypothetical protein
MKKLSLLNRIKPASAWAWSLLMTPLLSGCITEPKFPKEPRIAFESIQKINKPAVIGRVGGGERDSVIITIRFEDGDGDLGITEAQKNVEPWKSELKNYEVQTFVKRGNTWEDYKDGNGKKINQSGNFVFDPPVVNPSTPSPIEGSLNYSLIFYKNVANTVPNDTIKFNILIRDRALNKSNRIETDLIVVYGN